MELMTYKCKYCGKEEFAGFPHYTAEDFELCLDCAFRRNIIEDNIYIVANFYSITWKNLENYRVVLKDSTDYKQIISCNDSPYEVVDITRDKYSNNRNYPEYNEWRTLVFERDNYTCCHCNKAGGILNAHHIKPYKEYPEERTNINNGITLCIECHKIEHKRLRGIKYGNKKNVKQEDN